ncbi:Wall-associated receptor kinase 1 [Dichanthelium oligosanthes]|uniref:Wall-associated receptor kinase 1 n=1 Tax=Dichanthelium oligosanthes TaxID=888268 RepID=A0A1E5V6S2_9POAL|nr:Wall-associated receptor kinase 1 [Dichanthelium oligosanthes]
MSFCSSSASVDTSGQCTGMGCCQTSIPANLTYFNTTFLTRESASVLDFNPCSYAFVIETQQFRFDINDLAGNNFASKYIDGVPLVLNWVAGTESCEEAKKNMTSYACLSKNSVCIPSDSGLGYLCNCSSGYGGNPYLEEGCQDIDECAFPEQYLCHGQCTNTIGSYICTCPKGTRSTNASTIDCSPYQDSTQTIKMVLGISISTVFLLLCIFPLVIKYQKRKLIKEKDGFFKQNGGFILLEQMRSRQVDTIREIIILSQINHRNVVRLLGCCLEVEVPMLVYEFIPNGTLFQLIHSEGSSISLDDRLRIAIESAEALAYLHSSAFPSIIHADVKSSNILLDDKYMAKVTDFGASHMVVKNESQFMTIVQGTLGYLDPEYLQERQLTEKSDVYSFGVVILELITRKTAIYSEDSGERKGLASSFMLAMKDDRLEDMLDKSIIGVGMEPLRAISELAKKCLSLKGEERPQMTEVVERLKIIRRAWQEKLTEYYAEETENVYAKPSDNYPSSIAQYRTIAIELEHGR